MRNLTAEVKVRIPNGLRQAIAEIAAKRYVSAGQIGREAMLEYLEKRGIEWREPKPKRKGAR